MKKGRALRRKLFYKKILRCYKYMRNHWGMLYSSDDNLKKMARRMAENFSCGCYMCGNPRHSKIYKGKEKLTIQERKAFQEDYKNYPVM